MVRKIILFFVVISTISCSPQEAESKKGVNINSIVPYDDNISYNFTDLTYFKDRWFLIFRESDSHAYGKNGIIKLYSRIDNENWKLIKIFEVDGVDLRDPKFSVDGHKLMVYIHGSKYNNEELLSFSDYRSVNLSGTDFGDLEDVHLDNVKKVNSKVTGNEAWPWRITWYKNKAYTFGYTFTPGSSVFDLYESINGKSFQGTNLIANTFPFRGEATIRIDDKGQFYAIIRSRDLILGKIIEEGTKKSFKVFNKIPVLSLGGPNFIFYKNKMLISGRDSEAMKVVLYSYDLESDTYERLYELPSGGDCGYAGMVIKDDELWMSYYSSHERYKFKHSNVYIKSIKLSSLGL